MIYIYFLLRFTRLTILNVALYLGVKPQLVRIARIDFVSLLT